MFWVYFHSVGFLVKAENELDAVKVARAQYEKEISGRPFTGVRAA